MLQIRALCQRVSVPDVLPPRPPAGKHKKATRRFTFFSNMWPNVSVHDCSERGERSDRLRRLLIRRRSLITHLTVTSSTPPNSAMFTINSERRRNYPTASLSLSDCALCLSREPREALRSMRPRGAASGRRRRSVGVSTGPLTHDSLQVSALAAFDSQR